MNYDLSPNSIRVYKSRLRKLMRVLPIAEEGDKEAIKREIITLENKLGVSGEKILDDKPGRKALYNVNISKYNEQLVQNSLGGLPEEKTSEERLARLEELAQSSKTVKSPGPIMEYITEVQFHIGKAKQTEGEEKQRHINSAREANAKLPEHRRLDEQIREISLTKEERDREIKQKGEELQQQIARELEEQDGLRQQAEEEFHNRTTGQ